MISLRGMFSRPETGALLGLVFVWGFFAIFAHNGFYHYRVQSPTSRSHLKLGFLRLASRF